MDSRQGHGWKTLEGSDACINLAGRSVNCRYTEKNRSAIFNSRIQTTELLNRVISSLRRPPPVWLNASTATIYRHSLDRPMTESTGELGGNEPGVPDTWRFSIRVATAWEKSFFSTDLTGTRKVAMRSAMTFSPDRGGVFDTFLALVRLRLGGKQGSGNQYVSWIHDLDFSRAVERLIVDDRFHGVVNISSPKPLPNRDFLRVLRHSWGIRWGLPAPRPLLELGTRIMQTESELVLKSRRVIPERLVEAGFTFHFPDWPSAAEDLVRRWRQHRSIGHC